MTELREGLITALTKKYEAQSAEAKINIEVLLNNQVGVAEHPGVIETIDGELHKLAEAEDKLLMLNENFVAPPTPKVV